MEKWVVWIGTNAVFGPFNTMTEAYTWIGLKYPGGVPEFKIMQIYKPT